MKNKTLKFGWSIIIGGVLMIGTLYPAFAATERDTTKITKCNAESSAPQFLTCQDAALIMK